MNNTTLGLIVVLVVLVVAVRLWRSRHEAPAQEQPAEPSGRSFVRTYRGSAREAGAQFQRDAAALAAKGYVPTNQTYTPGVWSGGQFLLALILFVVLIGILIFIYMLIVKPAGTLVVTYEYRSESRVSSSDNPPRKPLADPSSALASLARMRDAGHITPEEYDAKKAEIIGRM